MSAPKDLAKTAAIAAGLKHYFTGKPCKHGHIDRRRVADRKCVTCRLLAKKRSYHANRKEIRARRKAVDDRNRETRRAKDRASYAANAELFAQKRRLHRADKPEASRLVNKRWRERHPEAARNLNSQSKHRRRAIQRGAFVEHVTRKTVLKKHKGLCGICHLEIDPMSSWHLDHIVPLAKGGLHCRDNVQPAHAQCNLVKGAR